MMLTREQREFLASDAFRAFSAAYVRNHSKYGEALRLQMALRAEFPDLPAACVSCGMAQMDLRRRASGRIGLPDDALYTPDAVEQASSRTAAAMHASLFPASSRILEICAGVGADTAALSATADRVVAIERDETTARFLRHNLHSLGRRNVLILRGAAERWLPTLSPSSFDAVYADPSRRAGGRRTTRIDEYLPPVSLIAGWVGPLPLVIKIAPAADVTGTWQRIFLAVGDACPEQLLVRGIDSPSCCAIDADTGERWVPPHSSGHGTSPESITETASYLIEPHGAIIRTGGLAAYFSGIDAVPVDPRIAYGVSEHLPPRSRWHTVFRIIDSLPWDRRRVRDALRALDAGPGLEVKKRGVDDDPDAVRAWMRLDGTTQLTLVLTRTGSQRRAWICERLTDR